MNTDAKETIRAKLSIESVVGSYIKLEPSGKNFRACCPFHGEKTPSFYVTPSLGIYKCFGCHKGGDIFKFVEEIENIPFIEALRSLAEKAGVSLDEYKNEKPSRLAILRQIMEDATKFYEIGLRTNKSAVEYLQSRGMTKETMVSFRVGYAEKDWAKLYDYLKRKKYSDDDILATGLCLKGKQAGLYDRFRERIMFPITDGQGRIIAFTGRVMPGTEEALRPVGKYINSPETELYHKSAVLFGYDKAKSAIHTNGFAIIVEGQMDCIMSHQAGVTNVIALSGTASTDEHMVQLARFTNNIAICLDADPAGLAAAQKTAMVAYKHEMQVLVIDVPGAKDPADIIANNPESWKEIVKNRKDFITFRLEKMKENHQEKDKVTIATKELFPILMHIQSQIVLDDKLKEIATSFGQTSIEPIRKEFEKFLVNNPKENPLVTPVAKKQEIGLEERIIGILLALKKDDVRFTEKMASIPDDVKSQYVFQTEQLLGILPEALPMYERTLHDLLIRYELAMIEGEKQQLDRELVHDPENREVLQKVHELLKRKHALIHDLNNH
jgi:DNA primase